MQFLNNLKVEHSRKKLLKEYDKICVLDTKASYIETFNDEQAKIIRTQRDVLLNNFRAMARMYAELVPELHISNLQSMITFQGCPSRVLFDGGVMDATKLILPFEISYEEAFLKLDLSTSFCKLLHKKAINAIKAKAVTFCTKYNTKNSIAINFVLETDEVPIIKERATLLNTYFNSSDMYIMLGYKGIKYIPRDTRKHTSNERITQFIKDMGFEKYDYIIQGTVW